MEAGNLVGTRLGKYELRAEIGRGGMGTVYRGFDPTLERTVAVKVLAPHLVWDREFVERFLREARSAAQLKHPNIVTIHDVGQDQGWYYFVMEFLEGQSLTEVLREKGPMAFDEAVDVLRPLAEALDYAHSRGLVHRDVKPANVAVGPDGHITLTDFGIVRAAQATRLTRSGMIMGTPEYMSPEQALGSPVDHCSDQYALAVMAYEVLTGRAPFEADSTPALLHLIAYNQPPPLRQVRPDLPAEVERTLERALAKKPDERYGSCREFLTALASSALSVIESQVPAANAPSSTAARIAARSVPIWAWGLGGLAIVAIAIGLVIGLGGRDRREMVSSLDPTEALAWAPTEAPTPTRVPTRELTQVSPEPTETVSEAPTPEPPPSGPGLGDAWTRLSDGAVMVYVPQGTFQMGSDYFLADDDEQPVHTVALDAFWIDRTEVTAGQFALFLNERGSHRGTTGREWLILVDEDCPIEREANEYRAKSDYANHPVIEVTWYGAAAYCEWADARLPTEAEWEFAARGPESLVYPWGDEYDGNRLNHCDYTCEEDYRSTYTNDGYARTAPVGSYLEGASWCGALDLAGNVREWVADWYDPRYYEHSPAVDPQGPSDDTGTGERVARGGGWQAENWYSRSAARLEWEPDGGGVSGFWRPIGFRCARDAG